MSLRREYYKIEHGNVVGMAKTRMVGSTAEFFICSLDEAEEMTDQEYREEAFAAMLESIDFNF